MISVSLELYIGISNWACGLHVVLLRTKVQNLGEVSWSDARYIFGAASGMDGKKV